MSRFEPTRAVEFFTRKCFNFACGNSRRFRKSLAYPWHLTDISLQKEYFLKMRNAVKFLLTDYQNFIFDKFGIFDVLKVLMTFVKNARVPLKALIYACAAARAEPIAHS